MSKKVKVIITVVVACILVGGSALLLFGGKPTVNLNDYVKITESGYDGYGYINASIDFKQLLEDYEDCLTDKNLNTQDIGELTPALAADFIIAMHKPYELSYDAGENLKNGDKVVFSWKTNESAIEKLAQVLEAEIKYSDFAHEVKELKALKEVDVFENLYIETYGISGKGSVTYSVDVPVLADSGDTVTIELRVDTTKNGSLSNGDSVRVTLGKQYSTDSLAKTSGIRLKRTEADVTINNFSYYAHENPAEVLTHIGGIGIENALKAVKEWMDEYGEERTYEYVGAVYYYQNEGHALNIYNNDNNQLLLIFRVDNGKVPGGWYTYLAPCNNVVIKYMQAEDGKLVKETYLDSSEPFTRYNYNYYRESDGAMEFNKYSVTFKHNGEEYIGHRTIEECIKAFEQNKLNGQRKYDHVIGDEVTKAFVNER